MKDLDIAIVLLGRQQDRLSRQIKALFADDFDYPTLKRWRGGWASELPLLKYHPELLPAVDALLEEMEEGLCPFSVMDKARLEVWKYHKACWPLLKDMGIDLGAYMDDFGAIDPELKRRFRRKYESKKRLTNQQQADWLQSILVPWVDGQLAKRRRNASVLMATADGYSKARKIVDAAKRFMNKS
jgi:hypothetical protein